MTYRPPELLGPAHELDAFVCASAEQTDRLAPHARQSMATGTTKVFVVTPAGSHQVVAYYAWTMAQISLADAPVRLRKGAGSYPQPVALLARLGVHRDHERQGLGAALRRDPARRRHQRPHRLRRPARALVSGPHCGRMDHDMAEDDLRTLVREFRTSLSDDLSATHRQMAELSDEVRARITTAETAILNAVRDMGRDIDRRRAQVERLLSEADARLERIEDAQRD